MSTPICVSHQCKKHHECSRFYANVSRDTLLEDDYYFGDLAEIIPAAIYVIHEGKDIARCGYLVDYKMFLPMKGDE